METINVAVGWSGNNFSAGWGDSEVGMVLVTAKTYGQLMQDFRDALDFHLEGMVEHNDPLPQWLIDGDYELKFELNAAALIRRAEEFTTMAAISRASGINQKQLSHYANGTKTPREAQRQRILDGLHKIGQACMAL